MKYACLVTTTATQKSEHVSALEISNQYYALFRNKAIIFEPVNRSIQSKIQPTSLTLFNTIIDRHVVIEAVFVNICMRPLTNKSSQYQRTLFETTRRLQQSIS